MVGVWGRQRNAITGTRPVSSFRESRIGHKDMIDDRKEEKKEEDEEEEEEEEEEEGKKMHGGRRHDG